MINKSTINARMIFAFMVPLTLVAFLLGYMTVQNIMNQLGTAAPQWPDYLGIVTATVGVCLFNWYEEKPQKASIETM